MQLTIERAVLESLREQAGSASDLVGRIAERAADRMVEQLSDEIDAIFQQLSKLLGNPHPIAANENAAPAVALIGPIAHVLSERLSKLLGNPGNPNLIAAPAPAPDPAGFVIGFTDDESMRPNTGRFRSTPHALLLAIERDDRHARGRRWMAIDVAGASLWWRRGATVAGLLVLVDLVGRLLGSCGGAR